MTPESKQLVQDSWRQVAPISEAAAELFYGRLFELDPQLRPLFAHTDLKEQGKKLMQMLAVVVKGLDNLDKLVPAVAALGQRHGEYGVKDEHYDTVAAALLWTLEKGLGEGFTAAVRQAWIDAYSLLSMVMKRAAAAPAGQPA